MVRHSEIALVRSASRRLVRELGFLQNGLAGTRLPPSAVHALMEIGARGSTTAVELSDILLLEKSTVSRMLHKLIDGGEVSSSAHKDDGRAKRLTLTEQGRVTLEQINVHARSQVEGALARLTTPARKYVCKGLSAYARALTADRMGMPEVAHRATDIAEGYRPGVIGSAVEMHARFYSRNVGFGNVFESKIAAGMANFAERLERPCNELWSASIEGKVVGTVAIDGEDIGQGVAHLRWFIVDDGLRGAGIGRELLARAVRFSDARGFGQIHLWTFRGLEAARLLYEASGFELVDERPGHQWGEEVIEQQFVRTAPSANTAMSSILEM